MLRRRFSLVHIPCYRPPFRKGLRISQIATARDKFERQQLAKAGAMETQQASVSREEG
jgi:hypothetical protein